MYSTRPSARRRSMARLAGAFSVALLATIAGNLAPNTAAADAGWSVQLTASTTLAQVGQSVTLTATATGGTAMTINIVGYPSSTACSASSCTATESMPAPSTNDYQAIVQEGTAPYAVMAESPVVYVTWGQPSDQCGNIFAGYIGTGYAQFGATARTNGAPNAVCYRIDSGGTEQLGGALIANGLVSEDTAPSTLCQTTAGNTIPGPHPVVAGTAAGGERFMLDLYQDATGNTWLCMELGTSQQRLIFSPSTTPIERQTDTSPNPEPQLPSPDSAAPSQTCHNHGVQPLIDADVDGAIVYVATYSPSATAIDLCEYVMDQNPSEELGGLLTVNGATPPAISSDLSPCTFPILQLTAPVSALLASSPPGVLPATLCIAGGGEQVAVSTGAVNVPPSNSPVTFTPDSPLPA